MAAIFCPWKSDSTDSQRPQWIFLNGDRYQWFIWYYIFIQNPVSFDNHLHLLLHSGAIIKIPKKLATIIAPKQSWRTNRCLPESPSTRQRNLRATTFLQLYNGHSCRINQKETRQRDVCRSNFRNIRNWPFNCTKSHRRIPSVKQTPTGLPLLDNPVLYSPYKNFLNIIAFATPFNSFITVMANCQCPESLMTTDTNIHCTSPHKRPLYGDGYQFPRCQPS